jgi:hypothetical protein
LKKKINHSLNYSFLPLPKYRRCSEKFPSW